ncbi:MAG: hypothetical protein A2285_05820 [Elusimicrobia bacterium RIFOXYA12_FULL_57_11]|nr:MAG: hypothetical protein A2285_05820 [Elusimicrobia bacterium RIFOXYA12_FULL_57_11]
MGRAGFIKILALTRVEWRLRQQSTFLGFFWTLLNPALMFVVLYGLFIKWLGRAQSDYAVFLLVGIVEWNFFSTATSHGLSALLRRGPLLKNYPLAPEIPVFASVLSIYFSHVLELLALIAMLSFFQGRVTVSWFWLIAIDGIYLALACGVSLLLAGLFVFYSDIERMWGILLTAGFFMTPVFYPLSVLTPDKSRLLNLSPLTAVIESSRLALSGAAPGGAAMGGALLWATTLLISGLLFLRLKRASIGDAL